MLNQFPLSDSRRKFRPTSSSISSELYLIANMNNNEETYLLLLLADGNLPTGSFVASSGLESFVTHGFFNKPDDLANTIDFVRDSVATYARSALPFVSDTHEIVATYAANSDAYNNDSLDQSIIDIRAMDNLYEAMTLNHVAKRASKSQGVALLTLYSRGFSRPPSFASPVADHREKALTKLVDRFKLTIRKEETYGHLPVCWGLLTAALGLSLGKINNLCCKDDHLICCRTLPVPAPFPSREELAICICPTQHNRTICIPASAVTRNPSHRRSRVIEIEITSHFKFL